MLKGFEEDLANVELPDEVKQQLIDAANKRADGLVQKNEELLGKLNQTKTKVKENQSAEAELAELRALTEQKELESKQHYDAALALNTEKYNKKIDELTQKVSLFEQKERDLMIGKSINDALASLRVNPLHQELVTSYFKQQAQLIDGEVMIKDKSLSEVMEEWSETDQGKAFRMAPDNSGGNANGGSQNVSGSGQNMTDQEKRAHEINKRFGRA